MNKDNKLYLPKLSDLYDIVVKMFTPSGMIGDDETAPSMKELFSNSTNKFNTHRTINL